jgi:hypothetical protein
MAVTKRLAVWQLVATGLGVAIQAASGSQAVFESGLGQLFAYAWLALSLVTIAAAALKAYDNHQIKWLVAILFVWPLMYPYVFRYAHASRY